VTANFEEQVLTDFKEGHFRLPFEQTQLPWNVQINKRGLRKAVGSYVEMLLYVA